MRKRLLLIPFLSLLLVALGACGPAEQPAASVPAAAQNADAAQPPIAGETVSSSAPYFDMQVNQPAPDFSLTNQDGQPVSLSDLRGSFVLLDFIYTSCPDVCPLMTANFRRVQDEMGDRLGKGVYFVSITLDPDYDTPAVLKSYATAFQANLSGWHFLTGDGAQIAAVAAAYQQTYEKVGERDIDHTALTVLIDPSGRERHRYWGTGFPPGLIADKIAALGQSNAEDAALVMAANAQPAAQPLPPQAEIDALLEFPQGHFVFLIDAEEAAKTVRTLSDKLTTQGWTQADKRTGVDQEAYFFHWGNEQYIGIGRNLDGIVILQDADPVRLWTDFFARFKLYCCA